MGSISEFSPYLVYFCSCWNIDEKCTEKSIENFDIVKLKMNPQFDYLGPARLNLFPKSAGLSVVIVNIKV